MKKAQASMEMLILSAFMVSILLLGVLLYVYYDMLGKRIVQEKTDQIECNKIANSISEIYASQGNAKMTIQTAAIATIIRNEKKPGQVSVGVFTCNYFGSVDYQGTTETTGFSLQPKKYSLFKDTANWKVLIQDAPEFSALNFSAETDNPYIDFLSGNSNQLNLMNKSSQITILGISFFGGFGADSSIAANGSSMPIIINPSGNIAITGISFQNMCESGGKAIISFTVGGTYDDFFINCNSGILPAQMPIAWYKLDESSGNTASDSVSPASNGTVNPLGTATWNTTTCPIGNCLNLNGTTQYIDMANPAELQTTGDLTISYWAKPTNLSIRRSTVCKAYGGEQCMTVETSGRLYFFHGSAGGNSSPYMNNAYGNGVFEAGAWVHVTVTRNTTSKIVSIYKNGVNIRDISYTINPSASTVIFKVSNAAYFANSYFLGSMDDIKVFNRVLSPFEICSECKEGAARAGITCNC